MLGLLGEPDCYGPDEPNTFWYGVMMKFNWDDYPVETKTLAFQYGPDSTITGFWLNHWEK